MVARSAFAVALATVAGCGSSDPCDAFGGRTCLQVEARGTLFVDQLRLRSTALSLDDAPTPATPRAAATPLPVSFAVLPSVTAAVDYSLEVRALHGGVLGGVGGAMGRIAPGQHATIAVDIRALDTLDLGANGDGGELDLSTDNHAPDLSAAADGAGTLDDAATTDDAAPDMTTCSCLPVELCVPGGCAPRPLVPQSTATVTSVRPLLRWSTAAAGVHVQICRDRACTMIVTEFDAAGTSGAPPVDLPAGMLFWRLADSTGGTLRFSPAWELYVPHNASPGAVTPNQTSSGCALDFNGDGFSDLILTGLTFVFIYNGSATGLPATPTTILSVGDALLESASCNDFDGDGFVDLALGHTVSSSDFHALIDIYRGGPGGLAAVPTQTLHAPDGAEAAIGASDLDRDGYGDLIAASAQLQQVFIYRGGPGGIANTPAITVNAPANTTNFGGRVGSIGDLDGDGRIDVFVEDVPNQTTYVYLNHGTGPGATPDRTFTSIQKLGPAGDVNGDSVSDVTATGDFDVQVRFGVSGAGLPVAPSTVINPDAGPFVSFIGGIGDTNGDGRSDVLVSFTGSPDPSTVAHLYLGGGGDLGIDPDPRIVVGADAGVPDSAAGTGDYNNDGKMDFVFVVPGGVLLYLSSLVASRTLTPIVLPLPVAP